MHVFSVSLSLKFVSVGLSVYVQSIPLDVSS